MAQLSASMRSPSQKSHNSRCAIDLTENSSSESSENDSNNGSPQHKRRRPKLPTFYSNRSPMAVKRKLSDISADQSSKPPNKRRNIVSNNQSSTTVTTSMVNCSSEPVNNDFFNSATITEGSPIRTIIAQSESQKVMRLKKQIRLLQSENQSLRDGLQKCGQMCIDGTMPRFDDVRMQTPIKPTANHRNYDVCSVKMNALRQYIFEHYSKKIIAERKKSNSKRIKSCIVEFAEPISNIDSFDDNIASSSASSSSAKQNESNNSDRHSWTEISDDLCKNSVLRCIKRFIRINGGYECALNIRNAWLHMNDSKKRQLECVETFDIIGNHRIAALVGQKGLRSTIAIPKYTVLGQYCGIVLLDEEYKDIYAGTAAEHRHNIYAFNLKLTAPNLPTNFFDILKENQRKKHKYCIRKSSQRTRLQIQNCITSSSVKQKTRVFKIVIDAIGLDNKGVMAHINDCRKKISDPMPTTLDNHFMNCKFIECCVNGWPTIFVVTIKDVPMGVELFADYGPEYGGALKDWQRMLYLRQCVTTDVQTQVLDPLNISL